jgi:hypothetical protein
VKEIFEKDNDFLIFLRPDNHIAFISGRISVSSVTKYVATHFDVRLG